MAHLVRQDHHLLVQRLVYEDIGLGIDGDSAMAQISGAIKSGVAYGDGRVRISSGIGSVSRVANNREVGVGTGGELGAGRLARALAFDGEITRGHAIPALDGLVQNRLQI